MEQTLVTHVPVLLEETITALDLKPADTIVDGTFGGGGHAKEMRKRIPEGLVICVDLDEEAKVRFEAAFAGDTHAIFVQENFKEAKTILERAAKSHIDKVLLDLGTSTYQLLNDTRGFSFQSDTPLTMTFSQQGSHTGYTAFDIVNTWQESSIADIVYYYGGEPKARIIARAIVEARKNAPIKTSADLAALVLKTIPRRGKIHPATKTFQALRIAVNDEVAVISEALSNWLRFLALGGRIAVIAFHSLEDRSVKRWMQSHTDEGCVITKKPIKPSRDEILANPRARSATLRVFQKHAAESAQ